MTFRWLCAIVVLSALAVLAQPGVADNYTWDNVTGNWSEPTNWTPDAVPIAGDNVSIAREQTVTVDVATPILGNVSLGSAGTHPIISGAGPINMNGTLTLRSSGVLTQNVGTNVNVPIVGATLVEVTYSVTYLNAANTLSCPININPSGTAYGPWLVAGADGALGSGNISITGGASWDYAGRLYIQQTQTTIGTITTSGANAEVHVTPASGQGAAIPVCPTTAYNISTGSGLYIDADMPVGATLNLADGAIFGGYRVENVSRNVHVYPAINAAGNLKFAFTGGYWNNYYIDNDIVGSGTITVRGTNTSDEASNDDVYLTKANNAFTGNWRLELGLLYVNADKALGAGPGQSVVVDGAAGPAKLIFRTAQTGAPALSAVNGGVIRLDDRDAAPALHEFGYPITLNGGILQGRNVNGDNHAKLTADLTVVGSGRLETLGNNAGRALEIAGNVRGTGALTVSAAGATNAPVILSNNNLATYRGDITVINGQLQLAAASAAGAGNLVAMTAGTIRTNAPGSLDGSGGVRIKDGGGIDINSAETRQIYVEKGGSFKITSGNTPTYTQGSGTVQVEAGCILDGGLSAFAFPTKDDFLLGDEGYGAYQATTAAGTYAVGLYSGTIWRGLAASNATLGATVIVNETAPGLSEPEPTYGVGFRAAGGATLTFNGCPVTTRNGNPVKLSGKGNFTFTGTAMANFNSNVESSAAGQVKISAAGGVPADKTLTMKAGYLDLDAADAVAGAVVLESGSAFNVDQTMISGAVTVKGGAGVSIGGSASLSFADAWSWQAGASASQAYLYDSVITNALPGPGVTSYYFNNVNPGASSTQVVNNIVLGNNSRIMPSVSATGGVHSLSLATNPPTGGEIVLDTVGGATQGTLAAWAGQSVSVNTRINFGAGGTLIVGDTNGQHTAMAEGAATWYTLSTRGTVSLLNDNNSIGAIDIRGGTLHCQRVANLGGARTINIASGAALLMHQMNPAINSDIPAMITGSGFVKLEDGTYRLTVMPAADYPTGLSPGASAGVLTIRGALAFGAPIIVGADTVRAKYVCEIFKHGNVAGDSHDQIAVTGLANLNNGELSLKLPLPGKDCKPSLINATIIDAGSVSGAFGNITVSELAGLPAGVVGKVAPHWLIDAGNLVIDAGAGNVNLVLSAADWDALPGDADLSNSVDYLDLGILAGNYRRSVSTWLQADFDFDGEVNYLDLGALAGNYRKSWPGAEGAPAPEPASLSLLALGLAALLRRRR